MAIYARNVRRLNALEVATDIIHEINPGAGIDDMTVDESYKKIEKIFRGLK